MFHSRKSTLTVLTTATAVLLLTAGPAAAHVEVEVGSGQAQALAQNVTISFDAESESDSAGIREIRVVLPEGIAPADVTFGEGPEGWKLTATADGYTVGGTALKTGTNAEYSIVVRQLPDAKELAFKTLQTYADGRTDRWIELDENGENPAPTLKLKAAAPGATPVASTPTPSPSPSVSASPTPTPDAPSPAAEAEAEAEEKSDDDGLSTAAWFGIGAAVLVAAAGAVFLVRRRAGGAR